MLTETRQVSSPSSMSAAHTLALMRAGLPGVLPHDRLGAARGRVTVCGLVITRQRPGTASGVIFLTLEDETGVSNIVVWPKVYERFRRAVIGGRLLRVTGQIQREGEVIHLIAWQIEDMSERLSDLGAPPGGGLDPARGRADEARPPIIARGTPTRARHPRDQAKVLFPSRDFH